MNSKEIWVEAVRSIDSHLDYLRSRQYTDPLLRSHYEQAIQDEEPHRKSAIRALIAAGGTPADIPDPLTRLAIYLKSDGFPETTVGQLQEWERQGLYLITHDNPDSWDYRSLPPDLLPKAKKSFEKMRAGEPITPATALNIMLEVFRGQE